MKPRLNARSLKCTVVLSAEEIVAVPDIGTPRVTLAIHVEGLGVVTTDIAAKSLRKAQNTIAEHGTDAAKAAPGNKLVEAGLVAQVKAPKPVVAEVAA